MWVVPWIRRLDRAMQFAKTEAPLRELTKLPSEYVHDHLRFTPFAGEPVGWMIEQAGADLFMFSSDYPHPEGTKDPIGRFESTLDVADDGGDGSVLQRQLRGALPRRGAGLSGRP